MIGSTGFVSLVDQKSAVPRRKYFRWGGVSGHEPGSNRPENELNKTNKTKEYQYSVTSDETNETKELADGNATDCVNETNVTPRCERCLEDIAAGIRVLNCSECGPFINETPASPPTAEDLKYSLEACRLELHDWKVQKRNAELVTFDYWVGLYQGGGWSQEEAERGAFRRALITRYFTNNRDSQFCSDGSALDNRCAELDQFKLDLSATANQPASRPTSQGEAS